MAQLSRQSASGGLNGDSQQIVNELLARILASSTFDRSARLRDFLRFVCERTLQNREAEIHENEIAVQVFGRPPDSRLGSEDTIVRSSARLLRAKLREYFEKEGSGEPLILEIPTGSYVPQLRSRTPVETPAVAPAPPAPPAPVAVRGIRLTWVLGGLALVFLATSAALYLRGRSAAVTPPDNLLRRFIFRQNQPTYVVVADSSLVVREDLLGRGITLDEYTSRSGPDPAGASWAANPQVAGVWTHLAGRQYTSIADLAIYEKLLRQSPDFWPQIVLRFARTLSVRDFSTGNFVLLGNENSVPWSALFRERLNFRFQPFNPSRPASIRNAAPRAGEALEFVDTGSGDAHRQFHAILAMAPNLGHSGNVLMVSGSSMEATEAAGLFALDPASLKVLAQLGADPAKIESFELVLRIGAIQGSPYEGPVLVASRITLRK